MNEKEKNVTLFAVRLRELIERKNVTISSLAKCVGITRQAVSQYCDGSTQPNAETIFKIARHFNVSADYLLGLSDVPSVDTDLKAVCDYTGLSQEAVELIKENSDIDADLLKQFLDVRDLLGEIVSIIKKN